MDRGATCFPAWLRDEQPRLDGGGEQRRPNLSAGAQRYLDRLGLGVEDLFRHALAVLHDPAYREANAGALRMEWPRIPLPGWPNGDALGAADELRASAARGREMTALLDPETPVAGVTAGILRPELAVIAVPSTTDGRNMTGDDFALTVGWGHFGAGDSGTPRQPSAATVTAPAPTPTPVPTASAGPAVETGLAADCLPGGVLDTDLIRLFRSANLHQRGDNTCHA